MAGILLIEDNEKVAEIVSEHLRGKGLECDVAKDGVGGLRAFGAKNYDLLLVDIRLPLMNGDEVCRKVRQSTKGAAVPIIVMSGYVKEPSEIERLTSELKLNAYLTKPFTSEMLYSLVAKVLAETVQTPAQTAADAQPPAAAAPAHARKSAPKQPPVTGDLAKTPFEQVLLYLLLKRGTGILTATREPERRRFFFIDGAPVDIEAFPEQDDFGSYLASKNLVTAAELAEYEKRRSKPGDDPRELFIKMGCLTPHRFVEESSIFLRTRLSECFGWRKGNVHFEWKPIFLQSFPAASALLPGIFLEGFRNHLTPAALSAFVEAKGRLYAAKAALFYDYQNHFAAELQAAEILDLIDGSRTCSDIAAAADAEDSAVLLYTLDYLKLLAYTPEANQSGLVPPYPVRERARKTQKKAEEAFVDLGGELSALAGDLAGLEEIQPPAAAPAQEAAGLTALEEDLKKQWEAIKDKNYYEIFGMAQNSFSFDKLKKSYFDFTRTYGPEKFFASSGETMSLAQEFLSKIANAYNTLSNVVSKENYDEVLASKIPTGEEEKKFYEKVQFQSGKVMLDQGQYDSAERAFTNCLTLQPEKPEYMVYLALAMYNNPANRGNVSTVKRAKDLVNKSLQYEKTSIAYALKGNMLLDEGMVNLAEAEYNKALKLNPNNKTAQKKLDSIKQRREEEKKGFFQKMFK